MKPARILPVPHSINLRELGGYATDSGQYIAWRKLLRSGSMGHLRPEGGEMLEDYGVIFDVDLRTDDEVKTRPDRIPRTISFQHLSVYPFTDKTGLFKRLGRKLRGNSVADSMADTYCQMLTDGHANAVYAHLFSILLSNDQPNESVVFHCTAGKDRTGVAAMMIEGALGVPEATIREDYLLTNLVLEAPDKMAHADLMHGANQFVNQMNSHQAETSNYDAIRQLIDKEYGDWEGYLTQQLHLTHGDLNDLRAIYLTDSANPEA
ncbi:tyrosine-protein phosphatase [Lacticaseibacillus sp. GG6-2]